MSLTQNNPLIILSEIGQILDIDNINEKKLISEKINNKEIYIYDNNGVLITDIENIFSKNKNNGNISTNKEEKYFIFNKKYDKDSTLKKLDDYIQKEISNYNFQLNLDMSNCPDVYTHFNLLIDKSSHLKYIQANDIKSTYEKMLEFFENFKVIFKTFKINSHICEAIKNNYKYQNYSINALINNINKINELCESKKNDATNENARLLEIKENNLKILNEGLDNLRKQEIHPVLQNNGKKYLIDIYLDVKKMETTKDDLIKKEEMILKFLREKSVLYINETNKIVNEKAKSITEIKNDWSNISLEYENKVNELNKEPDKIYEDLLKDFLYFKQSLLIIFEYLNNSSNNLNKDKELSEQEIKNNKAFDDSCQKINSLKSKYNDFSSLTQLQSKLDPINEICLKMRKNLENFSLRINKIFNTFNSINKNLNEIGDKFSQIKEKLINLEECFNQLKNPSKFPMAYESALEEIKRRMLFNYKIKELFKKIGKFVSGEMDLRKKFKSEYGIYLPTESFPCLKYFELKLKCEINTDDEINKFPKLLTEDEIKLFAENEQNFANISFEGNLLLNSGISESKKNKYQMKEEGNKVINNDMEQKIKDLTNELNEKDKIINNLQMQLETSINSIDKICTNFRFILSRKDKEINKKNKECDNLVSYINNRINNNIRTCPMCCEGALNNEQYSNINNFLNEIGNKLSSKELLLQQFQEKYSDLIIQTTQMKKIFFNHMNLKIANHNLNSKLNGGAIRPAPINNYENNNPLFPSNNDLQILKNIINEEKLKYNNTLSELNLFKAKYDSLICEMKKTESKNEELKIKLNAANEKLLAKLKEIETYKDEILLHDKQKKMNENSIIELRQFIKQISEEKKSIEEKKAKEISKIKNKSIIFKDIKEGDRCIFVPHSENKYVCINLTKDLNQLNNRFYRCDIILDFSTFEEDKKQLIIENNLILIGMINELKEIIIKNGEDNPYEINTNNEEGENIADEEISGDSTLTSIKSILKSTNSYYLAKIINVEYIIGFQGEELVFTNYNNLLSKKIINNV